MSNFLFPFLQTLISHIFGQSSLRRITCVNATYTLYWIKFIVQESFHAHFTDGLHQGESDSEVRLIDQGVSVDDVRLRESYWQHELDTFQPNGLNEREVLLF